MDSSLPRSRPRSVPVVVLDTLTRGLALLRRPFRAGHVPATQRIAIGIGAGIVTIGAAVLLVGLFVPTGPVNVPRRAATGATPAVGPAQGSGSPTPVTSRSAPVVVASNGSAVPSGPTASGTTTPGGATGPVRNAPGAQAQPLQARYDKVGGSESLASYRATVTVTNPGQVPVTGWSVTLTLPRETLTVSNASGATATRNAATWTFTPTAATGSVPAGASVTVTFQVNGAAVFDATPTACSIDGRACTGLAG
jgi:hypothetical protein